MIVFYTIMGGISAGFLIGTIIQVIRYKVEEKERLNRPSCHIEYEFGDGYKGTYFSPHCSKVLMENLRIKSSKGE